MTMTRRYNPRLTTITLLPQVQTIINSAPQEKKDLITTFNTIVSKLPIDRVQRRLKSLELHKYDLNEMQAISDFNALTDDALHFIDTIQELNYNYASKESIQKRPILAPGENISWWQSFKRAVVNYGVKAFTLLSTSVLASIALGITFIVGTALSLGLLFLILGAITLTAVAIPIIVETRANKAGTEEAMNLINLTTVTENIDRLTTELKGLCTPEPIDSSRASPIDSQASELPYAANYTQVPWKC